jgi:hypothetical protein
VIGDKGAGKTSHLLHWQKQTGGGYTYYPFEIQQRWQFPALGPIAYWDEVDRMPVPLLLTGLAIAKRQRSTIVAGTHECLKWATKLVGFRTQTIVLPQLTPKELLQWSQKKIGAVQLSDTTNNPLTLTPEHALSIVQQSDTSWRHAAALLHVWVAQMANQ